MQFDSSSFTIGEQTLLEIENQSKQKKPSVQTPLTTRNQSNPSNKIEIIEESPNAEENSFSYYQENVHDRLQNATQKARNRRKLEKTKSNPTFGSINETSDASSLTKFLQAGDIDLSAWEKSAARLISPAVTATTPQGNLVKFQHNSEPIETFSQFVFTEDELDQAISGDLSFNSSVAEDNVDDELACNIDVVTFVQPQDATLDREQAQHHIEEELIQQKSIFQASQAFDNESILNFSQNATTGEEMKDQSLSLDATKNLRLLSNWNLPASVINEYRKKNVTEMFEWQTECLKNPKVLFEGSNLVYSAPTSAGKTLVSEILMIKNIVERRKKALFVLPFVSVVREKMFYLQDLMASSGLRVEGFFGGYNPPGGFESIDLAVCTIEKANSIVNRLLEQNKLSDIGMIVIDEIHLISDSSRGYILELLLTKIMYMCEKFQHKIQLITMSATLPNVELLREWMNAEYFYTDYRPIELREMIKIGKNIYDQQMKLVRTVDEKWCEFFRNDTDEVCQLAMETIMENHQLIIFCPTKVWCEQICENVARGIHNMLKSKLKEFEGILDQQRVKNLLEQIKALPAGVDSLLQRSLGYACAFHHAGLTTDERDVIEMGFKDGTLKVLVATSTLSSGVNLPARRVIIRTPMFGQKMMSNLTYRQMIGRAGRKGKDILGESILVCSDATSRMGKLLVVAPLDPITSCLDVDGHTHLKRALLEIIASGVANTKQDLEKFVSSTLLCQQQNINLDYFQQSDDDLKTMIEEKSKKVVSDIHTASTGNDPIKNTMDFLIEYEFIRLHIADENEIQFVPTRLGLACLSSSMPPKDGFLLFSELQKAHQNFVLESELHAIYLVTPFSVAYQLQDIDWVYFAELHDRLPEMMKRVGTMVGVSPMYMIKAITGKQGSDWRAQQIHKRFYTAMALQELVNEKSISEVSSKYKIHRGLLQNLQQMASTFAGTVTTFCKSLQWNLLALILGQFRERLFFGIHPDLIDLMRLPSMSSTRIARSLFKNGIAKLSDLANSKALTVENSLMDLGENFFVVGKSMGMSLQEIAKLLINDARAHIQNEMGLKEAIKWSQQTENDEAVQAVSEVVSQAAALDVTESTSTSRKRKAEPTLSPFKATEVLETRETPKRKKSNPIDVTYRKKLRSSGGAQDFVEVNTQFMKDLDRKAEIAKGNAERSDENGSLFKLSDTEDDSMDQSDLLEMTQKRLEIIDVLADDSIFNLFMIEMKGEKEIAMSLGIQKFEATSQLIGGNVLNRGEQPSITHQFTIDETSYIDCISFCYNKNRICYVNLQKQSPSMIEAVKAFLVKLLRRSDVTLISYEAREHLKTLCKPLKLKTEINIKMSDPRLASWLTDPDNNLTWHQMIEKHQPENLPILELAVRHGTVGSLGLSHVNRVEPKIRTAVECFLARNLASQLLDVLRSEGKGLMARVYCDLEMPIQVVLVKMELAGMPVNETKLQHTIENATMLQRQLEQHIYELNGRKFNLSSSKEISKVLGILKKVEQKKVSTAKNVLEKLDLPIANCIMSWRTLSTTISNMHSLSKLVKKNRIYGTSFSLTQTGRISMYEPNLQNVTKDFDVEFKDSKGEAIHQTISFRRVYECQKEKVLLSADFCQLELRILTHLCKDKNLLEIMNSPGEDIFQKIAAKWNKIDEAKITMVQRNQAKQLCYGIIYGMGNKSLAESMKVDEETSAKLTKDFHATYPGIKRYSDKIVQKAREQKFIETVTGRRRYLPALTSENSSERSQAERQALNSCIQGSASDLVKNAILRMDRNVKKQNLRGCELVLHLHDELFYEVTAKDLQLAAKILQQSMQNCVKLSVPLLVRPKSGSSWGEMNFFEIVN